MSFLEEFDGKKSNEELPKEDRELLEFAQLIRKNRALPESSAKQELLEKLRNAEAPRKVSWISRAFLAVAAMVLLTVTVAILVQSTRQIATHIASTTGETPGSVSEDGISFPIPVVHATGGANTVESQNEKDAARALRTRGLVIYQTLSEKRWRVVDRGTVFKPGDIIKTSKRLGSSARVLGADGSLVSLSPASEIRYDGPREWKLQQGRAFVEAATRTDLKPFSLNSPQASITALGTKFFLSVLEDGGGSLCSAIEGRVQMRVLDDDSQTSQELTEGKSALARKEKGIAVADKTDSAWLDILNAELDSDYGVGSLIAKTEQANQQMPLEIKSHHVTATVIDQVARTFVDEVFVNNTDRRLEGVFYYPLPPDASISEFAMYVDGKRIVGEVLEQQRARQVFEYIVRQQRDPALLEWAGGNLFKMRVFPIEPRSEKRVQLGYTQILKRSNGKVTYTYPLYSEKLLKNPLHDLRIDFRVFSSAGLSDLISPSHQVASALTYQDGTEPRATRGANPLATVGAAAFAAKEYSPTRDFSMVYSVPNAAECVAFANLRPDDDRAYAMLQICPQATLPPREPPERILVIVDGSSSATPQEYAVATEFATSASEVSGNWSFGLIRGGQNPKLYGSGLALPNDKTAIEVRDFLQQRAPLGATDLLATFKAVLQLIEDGRGLQIVYVGDGIETTSELSSSALIKEIAALFKDKDIRISTVATGSNYDRPVLQGIAAALGGEFVHVDGASESHQAVERIFDSFYRPVLRDVRIEFQNLNVAQIYPETLGTLAVGDTGIVLGRLEANSPTAGRVQVSAVADGKPFSRAYNVNLAANSERNRFLPRLWARARMESVLAQMGLDTPERDAQTKKEVTDLSTQYQIMSPFTAFLVLESEEDYARFGIKRNVKMLDWTGEAAGIGGADGAERSVRLGRRDTTLRARLSDTENFFGSDARKLDESLEVDAWNGANLGLGLEPALRQEVESLGKRVQDEVAFDFDETLAAGDELSDLSDLSASFDANQDDSRSLKDGLSKSKSNSPRGFEFDYYGRGASARYSRGRFERRRSLNFRGDSNGSAQPAQARPTWQYERLFAADKREKPVGVPPNTEQYTQRIAARATDSKARWQYVLALESDGKLKEALDRLLPLIKEQPQNTEMHLKEGALRYKLKDENGGDAAFAKAIEVSTERPVTLDQVANLLSNANAYAKAAPRFAQLAREAASAEIAAKQAAMAVNAFAGANLKAEAPKLLGELLQKYPASGKVADTAANWYEQYENNNALALQIIETAEKTGANLVAHHVRLLAIMDKDDEALRVFRAGIEKAESADEAYHAIQNLQNVDGKLIASETMRLLKESQADRAVEGAAKYVSAYRLFHNRAQANEIVEILRTRKLPFAARIDLLISLNQFSANYRVKIKLDEIAEPLFSPGTPEECEAAIRAYEVLMSQNKPSDSDFSQAEKLLANAKFSKDQRVSILTLAAGALDRLHRDAGALAKWKQAFEVEGSAESARTPLQRLFRASVKANDFDAAAALIEKFEARYPLTPYSEALYPAILNALQQASKKTPGSGEKTLDALITRYPQNPNFMSYRARWEADRGKIRDAHQSALTALALTGAQMQPAANNADDADEETRRESAEARVIGAIMLVAKIASQDNELRRNFLALADAAAKIEDPVRREWTEAALMCLRTAADSTRYLQRLQTLADNEPNDPLWMNRLAASLQTMRKLKEARVAYEKILAKNQEDFETLLTLQSLCEELRDDNAAKDYFQRAFEALKKSPEQLQQYANNWQRDHPQWAYDAWRALAQNKETSQNGYAAAHSANLAVGLGKTDEAIAICFKHLYEENFGYRPNLLTTLTDLAQHEEALLKIEARLKAEAGTKKPAPAQIFENLLKYRIAKLRNNKAAMKTALDEAAAIDVGKDTAPAYAVINEMIVEPEAAANYAMKARPELTVSQRQELIRHTARHVSQDSQRQLAIRLSRKILEESPQSDYDRRHLIDLLIADRKLDAALDEARKINVTRNEWDVYYAFDRIIDMRENSADKAEAVKLALEACEKIQDSNSGHRQNVVNRLLRAYAGAMKNGKFDASLQKSAEDVLLKAAREHFSGEGSTLYWSNTQFEAWNGVDLLQRVNEMADTAAASNDPQIVTIAGDYFSSWSKENGRHAKAEAAYKRCLELPDVEKRSIYSRLFDLYSRNKDWQKALDVLEKQYAAKELKDDEYLQPRARCLYGLNRHKEAAEAVRAAIKLPEFLSHGYWQLDNFARECENAGDWATAAEVWEKALRMVKPSRGRDNGTFSRAYLACAATYSKLGQKDKALDCYLRGMSLIARNQSGYSDLMRNAIELVLRNNSLDAAVAKYESEAAKSGEKPHLRIAFAQAYKEQNNPEKRLANLRIAAGLLPKDVELRNEVLDGLRGAKKIGEAITACLEWVKLDPQNIDLFGKLGDLYEESGNREQALLAWSSMAQARPREAEGYRAYAKKLAQLGMNSEAAAAALRQAVRYRPTEYDIARELADVYTKLNQPNAIPALWVNGEKAARAAMEDLADDPSPWLNLGRFLGAQGKKDDERALYQRILSRSWPRFQNETHDEARKRLK